MTAMSTHDWLLPARYLLCPPADSLYRTGQAIFRALTGTPTPEAIAAAQEALDRHRAALLPTLYPMHYGVSVGRHICVEFVFHEATARLAAVRVQLCQPSAPPAPPTPPQDTLTAIVEQFEQETYLGDIGNGKDEGQQA
jgi:hypothetical protein